MSRKEILTKIEQLKHLIWEKRPILGEIMQKNGHKTLFEYAKDFLDVNPSPLLDERKEELIVVVEDLLKKNLGEHIAREVADELKSLSLVSTADHHSPIQHPFWVNSNIISALPYINNKNKDLKYLVVFSFASVSVNNASGFARGILFHGKKENVGNLLRYPLLPDKKKMNVVYAAEPYNRDELLRLDNLILSKIKSGEVNKEIGDGVREVINQYFNIDDVLNCPDLKSQITKINYRLWPNFFNNSNQNNIKIPDLIYLDVESIVTELLLRYHLNKNSLVHRVIFDINFQNLLLKLFNNLPGAFSLEQQWGTHLFWGIDKKYHRVRLFLKGNQLSSVDGELIIDLNPIGIEAALKEKKIFPSMMLCYLIVSLFYGIKCLGGFCQVHDLTMIKRAWRELLDLIGEKEESTAVIPVQTKELGGDGMILAYLENKVCELIPATGFDMATRNDINNNFGHFLDLSKKMTLSDVMAPMLPEMYTVLYSLKDRQPELSDLTFEQISKATGLDRKLKE